MRRSMQVASTIHAQLIEDMVDTRGQTILTWKLDQGWATLKTRFVGMNDGRTELLIESRRHDDADAATIEAGQSVEVSFRHRHKKLVFVTIALGSCRLADGTRGSLRAVRLQWPQRVVQLQRRVYHRAKVPGHVSIPVDLWRGDLDTARQAGASLCEGAMMDLSAGGISVALAVDRVRQWRENDTVSASFLLEPLEPPVRVSGQLRHMDALPDGRVQVGLQFRGLEADLEQHETLQRITQLAARLDRA